MAVEVRSPTRVTVLAYVSPAVQLGAPAGRSVTTWAVLVLAKGELPTQAGCAPAAPSCWCAPLKSRPVDDESKQASKASLKPAGGTSGLAGHVAPAQICVPSHTAAPPDAVVITAGAASDADVPFF